ncbi:YARHG domain-containing protein [Pseudobutyrivibrio sp. UC1225]|uniref:YARHG domain-containing protein n=1 Tax=Pseudobutyrivibrio sp. UC1225 TaxID=1798185 RepID=UPI0008ED1A93|nr:YARHG domain-containing protein [Pseudobutyrivibrio sp. UC1225]SFO33903.1 YARHG domain-containing protein [Pseudobutyrivibrio sp. UC1225]
MKKRFFIMILLCGLIITGCKNQKDDNDEMIGLSGDTVIAPQEQKDDMQIIESQSDEAKEENDYSSYSGVWTTDGISNEELLESGGTKLTLNITNGNQASGSIFSQQGITDRIADIDFSGEIHDNQLIYSFTDDGWDGKGTLNFTFANNEIDLNITDYVMSEDNLSGFGISGSYVFLPSKTSEKDNRNNCSFYPEIIDYLEAHGRTDTSNTTEPLFNTDSQYYTAEDFTDAPKSVIRVAKNEIYARHGYIFNDSDMSNYFNGMDWYTPSIVPANFSDNVFNEYEQANLELLNSIQ